MTANVKDVVAGGAFIALGLLFGWNAHNELEIGTAFRMGPGYFPVLLSGLLIFIGLVVAIQAVGKEQSPMTGLPWRGLVLILISPIVFGLTVRGLGFIPSVALVVIISAFASRRMSFLMAAIVTLGMTVFCTAVFLYGLGLPIRTLGPWLVG
jgi:hypothetical protein